MSYSSEMYWIALKESYLFTYLDCRSIVIYIRLFAESNQIERLNYTMVLQWFEAGSFFCTECSPGSYYPSTGYIIFTLFKYLKVVN